MEFEKTRRNQEVDQFAIPYSIAPSDSWSQSCPFHGAMAQETVVIGSRENPYIVDPNAGFYWCDECCSQLKNAIPEAEYEEEDVLRASLDGMSDSSWFVPTNPESIPNDALDLRKSHLSDSAATYGVASPADIMEAI